MLAKKLIPSKFIFGIGQIVIAGILMATAKVYPSINSSQANFVVGCALIILFTLVQLIFTFIGVNIFNIRIHFQNLIFNGFAFILLIWFALSQWPEDYIWYIWGFLCIYPFFNQIFGVISTFCHSKNVIYQKYRADQ